ncbi:RNA binding protein 42 [Fasciola hepatica]|uniref:RNA-binding protein 42 n=1 Tax=Fasciola hepatica TaxID=6192 RepID=A0A4E0RGI1_FASHE|nr:RNA binding protein 42 [Fasciola hepatica]
MVNSIDHISTSSCHFTVTPTVPLYVPLVPSSMPSYQTPLLPNMMAAAPLSGQSRTTPVRTVTLNSTTTATTQHTTSISKPAITNHRVVNTAATTVITAPPQMAGPNELAARAKEAAAAAAAAKLMAEDEDDDVTRALLAAAAGVTYTRIPGRDGKEQVRASITKPPLNLVNSQAPTDSNAVKSTVQTSNTASTFQSSMATATPSLPAQSQQQMLQLQQQQQQTTQVQQYYQQQIQQHLQQQQHQQQQQQQQSWKRKKKFIRVAAGTTWEDPTLAEWDPNDFRIFCGDLGNEVTDDTLTRAFNRYTSFQKARVVRDKRTGRSRGYGFVSFSDPADFTRAMREMNGKYVGNRPIKLKRSDWRTRQLETVRKKEKEKKKLGLKN